jgi:hypothetical protein
MLEKGYWRESNSLLMFHRLFSIAGVGHKHAQRSSFMSVGVIHAG